MEKYIQNEKEFYTFLDAKKTDGKRLLDDKDISVLGTIVHVYDDKINAANILIDSYANIINSNPINLGQGMTITPICDEHVRAVWNKVQEIISKRQ